MDRTPPAEHPPYALDPRADELLGFWFDRDLDDPANAPGLLQRWFQRDAAFDERLRERFGALVPIAAHGALDDWTRTPRGWLALLLLLDQLPRNLHRDSADAFAHDARARELALAGIARGDDARLHPLERVFAYLPLQHAEDLLLQERSVDLYAALRNAAPRAMHAMFDVVLDHAQRHLALIARFGRFPHRNAALGRESTAEERLHLVQPGAAY
jgi:uncharacterized protein (DUF924 family)